MQVAWVGTSTTWMLFYALIVAQIVGMELVYEVVSPLLVGWHGALFGVARRTFSSELCNASRAQCCLTLRHLLEHQQRALLSIKIQRMRRPSCRRTKRRREGLSRRPTASSSSVNAASTQTRGETPCRCAGAATRAAGGCCSCCRCAGCCAGGGGDPGGASSQSAGGQGSMKMGVL